MNEDKTKPVMVPLPEWKSNQRDWYSEHDSSLGDGYEYGYNGDRLVLNIEGGGQYFN